jgi:Do/DeqQ family serine protease
MKQLAKNFFAGIIGGTIVLLVFYYFNSQNSTLELSTNFAQQAYNEISPNKNVPFDFSIAAERTVDAVVHIHAKESRQMALQRKQQQRRNPFSFFFDDEVFGNPFYDRNYAREGSGSGVIMYEDGIIVTNNHVVEFADEIEVTLHDNRKFMAKKIGQDAEADVAVLKIEANGLKPISFGNSDEIKVGEWVVAVGNPFNLTSTVTSGIVSARGRRLGLNNRGSNKTVESFIQTDAAVNPGNSGGALVDIEGRLIGINTAIASPTGQFAGYAFAIPVNMVVKIVDDIVEFGEFRRAYLGIAVSDLDPELVRELKLPVSQGVVIKEIYEGGSAQLAGLLPNDVIVKIKGRDVRVFADLQEVVSSSKVGESLPVIIYRAGKEKKIEVKLKSAS